jgi:hypothetical protein
MALSTDPQAMPYSWASVLIDGSRRPAGISPLSILPRKISASWRRGQALLLGALLDHVAKVLKILPRFPDGGSGLDRMGRFAHILLAHDAAYGNGQTICLDAYQAAKAEVRASRAEAEPVVTALCEMTAPGATWEGTARQLHDALAPHGRGARQAEEAARLRELGVRVTRNARAEWIANLVDPRVRAWCRRLAEGER